MMGLHEVDVLGLFLPPAFVCFLAALLICIPLRWALDHRGADRYVWNRALFDLGLLVCVASLLVLSLRLGAL